MKERNVSSFHRTDQRTKLLLKGELPQQSRMREYPKGKGCGGRIQEDKSELLVRSGEGDLVSAITFCSPYFRLCTYRTLELAPQRPGLNAVHEY